MRKQLNFKLLLTGLVILVAIADGQELLALGKNIRSVDTPKKDGAVSPAVGQNAAAAAQAEKERTDHALAKSPQVVGASLNGANVQAPAKEDSKDSNSNAIQPLSMEELNEIFKRAKEKAAEVIDKVKGAAGMAADVIGLFISMDDVKEMVTDFIKTEIRDIVKRRASAPSKAVPRTDSKTSTEALAFAQNMVKAQSALEMSVKSPIKAGELKASENSAPAKDGDTAGPASTEKPSDTTSHPTEGTKQVVTGSTTAAPTTPKNAKTIIQPTKKSIDHEKFVKLVGNSLTKVGGGLSKVGGVAVKLGNHLSAAKASTAGDAHPEILVALTDKVSAPAMSADKGLTIDSTNTNEEELNRNTRFLGVANDMGKMLKQAGKDATKRVGQATKTGADLADLALNGEADTNGNKKREEQNRNPRFFGVANDLAKGIKQAGKDATKRVGQATKTGADLADLALNGEADPNGNKKREDESRNPRFLGVANDMGKMLKQAGKDATKRVGQATKTGADLAELALNGEADPNGNKKREEENRNPRFLAVTKDMGKMIGKAGRDGTKQAGKTTKAGSDLIDVALFGEVQPADKKKREEELNRVARFFNIDAKDVATLVGQSVDPNDKKKVEELKRVARFFKIDAKDVGSFVGKAAKEAKRNAPSAINEGKKFSQGVASAKDAQYAAGDDLSHVLLDAVNTMMAPALQEEIESSTEPSSDELEGRAGYGFFHGMKHKWKDTKEKIFGPKEVYEYVKSANPNPGSGVDELVMNEETHAPAENQERIPREMPTGWETFQTPMDAVVFSTMNLFTNVFG